MTGKAPTRRRLWFVLAGNEPDGAQEECSAASLLADSTDACWMSRPTARLSPIPDRFQRPGSRRNAEPTGDPVRERAGRRRRRTTRRPSSVCRAPPQTASMPAITLAVTAGNCGDGRERHRQWARACVTARLPPDRAATGNPCLACRRTGVRGPVRCIPAREPAPAAPRVSSGFPAGASCGYHLPEPGDDVRPARFQRSSGSDVLVMWPGGVPARRARRQWR